MRRNRARSTRGRSCSSSYLTYDHQPPEWKMTASALAGDLRYAEGAGSGTRMDSGATDSAICQQASSSRLARQNNS
jgi:hypothetical protein